MDLAENIVYTIKDIYALPDDERAELIDGQMYMMATPSRIHQKISGFFHTELEMYIRKKGGNCEVYAAPFSVFLFGNDETYLEPDLSVICDKNKLTDKGCNGAPDFVIEIVSPSSQSLDYIKKLSLYKKAGVRLYWIVNPESKEISVYNFENDTFKIYTFEDKIPVVIYEDCEIDMSVLVLD